MNALSLRRLLPPSPCILALVSSFILCIVCSSSPAWAQSSVDGLSRVQPDAPARPPSQMLDGSGLPAWAVPHAPQSSASQHGARAPGAMNNSSAPSLPSPPDQGSGGGGGGGGGGGTPIPVDGGLGLLAAAGAAYAANRLRKTNGSDDEPDDTP